MYDKNRLTWRNKEITNVSMFQVLKMSFNTFEGILWNKKDV